MYFHVFLHVVLYVFVFLDISKYTPLPLVVFLHVSLRTSSCRVFINRFWHFAAACHADLFSDFGTGHPQPDYFHIKIRLVAKSNYEIINDPSGAPQAVWDALVLLLDSEC